MKQHFYCYCSVHGIRPGSPLVYHVENVVEDEYSCFGRKPSCGLFSVLASGLLGYGSGADFRQANPLVLYASVVVAAESGGLVC